MLIGNACLQTREQLLLLPLAILLVPSVFVCLLIQGRPGPHQVTLSMTAPSLTQLDLTDNLIGPWSTVIDLCQQLPNLQLLVLSHNKLALPNSLDEAQQQGAVKLPGLQCLVMNSCGITWQQVRAELLCLNLLPGTCLSMWHNLVNWCRRGAQLLHTHDTASNESHTDIKPTSW